MALTREKALAYLELDQEANLTLDKLNEKLNNFDSKLGRILHEFLYDEISKNELKKEKNAILVKLKYTEGETSKNRFMTLKFMDKNALDLKMSNLLINLPNCNIIEFTIIPAPSNRLTFAAANWLKHALSKLNNLQTHNLEHNIRYHIESDNSALNKNIRENTRNKEYKECVSQYKQYNQHLWNAVNVGYHTPLVYLIFFLTAGAALAGISYPLIGALGLTTSSFASFFYAWTLLSAVTTCIYKFWKYDKGAEFKKAHPIDDEHLTVNQRIALKAGVEYNTFKGYFTAFATKAAYTEVSAFEAGRMIAEQDNKYQLSKVRKLNV